MRPVFVSEYCGVRGRYQFNRQWFCQKCGRRKLTRYQCQQPDKGDLARRLQAVAAKKDCVYTKKELQKKLLETVEALQSNLQQVRRRADSQA